MAGRGVVGQFAADLGQPSYAENMKPTLSNDLKADDQIPDYPGYLPLSCDLRRTIDVATSAGFPINVVGRVRNIDGSYIDGERLRQGIEEPIERWTNEAAAYKPDPGRA
jgi:hypothetical protein